MSIIAWNCRGLGRSQGLTIPRLMEMSKNHFPEVMFLIETMHGRDTLVDIQVWLGFDRVHTVDPVGKSGGLAVFWRKSADVEIKFSDKNLIDFAVRLGGCKCFVSCIYGDPKEKIRNLVWERITRIGINRNAPWCLVGDFNAICHNGEKLGGPLRCASFFRPFNDMLRDCKMKELPSTCDPFTWGGRRANKWIQCKLDRCFVNKEWSKDFPEANQSFLEKRGSDHRPVLVCLKKKKKGFKTPFKFDKRWLSLPNVRNTVRVAWNRELGSRSTSVSQRIKNCRHDLSGWRRNFQTNSKEKILKFQDELEREESGRYPNLDRGRSLKIELMKANREEEEYWSQKSYNNWLKRGDKNTRFFHDSVKAARGKKRIDMLLNENGREMRDAKEKGKVAVDYFSYLFSSSNPSGFHTIFTDFVARQFQMKRLSKRFSQSKRPVHQGLMVCLDCSFKGFGRISDVKSLQK
ncbi:hypothetical protein N665_0532s0058 [Sinapis alba]|nr:hypothetical protein N665_0532s0058 [Sinapis alba]